MSISRMHIAVVLAGGIGKRMGADIPKQFIEIDGKPVIIYTLEKFQQNEKIDAIEVVSVESYIEDVWGYAEKYNISKLKWVVAGGATAQESTRNGIFNLEKVCTEDDILMIHMSVSPLIDDEIINDALDVCKKYGNAIAANQSIFNICRIKDGYYSDEYFSKKDLVTLNMPWTIKYGKALWAYKKAYNENIGTDANAYLVSLLVDLGERLYFSKDSQKNKLKLTTFDDVDLLEGYLTLMKRRNSLEEG
ncbi:MAG: NTP transferase domain-containing protein [Lentisphaerae bacterium]|nr:NTP transferase domain-containing protein [Lentisphaerota bacterium]